MRIETIYKGSSKEPVYYDSVSYEELIDFIERTPYIDFCRSVYFANWERRPNLDKKRVAGKCDVIVEIPGFWEGTYCPKNRWNLIPLWTDSYATLTPSPDEKIKARLMKKSVEDLTTEIQQRFKMDLGAIPKSEVPGELIYYEKASPISYNGLEISRAKPIVITFHPEKKLICHIPIGPF